MGGFRLWLALTAVVILAGIAVPYGILGGGAPSIDILVFWCLFGLAVVVLIVAGFRRWKV